MDPKTHVDQLIAQKKVIMFSKEFCPFCTKAKAALTAEGIEFEVLELADNNKAPLVQDMDGYQDYLKEKTGSRSVPKTFAKGKSLGGCDDVLALQKAGNLREACGMLEPAAHIESLISRNKVIMFSKEFCPFCTKAKAALASEGIEFEVLELADNNRAPLVENMDGYQDYLKEKTGSRSVPKTFAEGRSLGGCDDVLALKQSGNLRQACGLGAAPGGGVMRFFVNGRLVTETDYQAAVAAC